ncbi:MAG: bifunctional phosphopantothenoylcysteine decarboxylase/phosphopantothenate--cysteine ligase CoaBC [Coriobacteriia bacterium]|nr:bifunctional phosphopantothenoylcysteine decarboxylase/phosphopantothenate--cysteine ligase CoaBC [Coriobacteriia bacterium]
MTNQVQKTILLGITGGIAAYKMCDLARQLVRAGHKVKVVMTQHATEFVGPATFRSLTGNPVALDLFDDPAAPINHISLAEEADIFLIAPATANVIAKLAQGRADDLLTTTALAYQGQLLVAPAMNTQMYLDAATQENLALLAARGVQLVGPATGQLACGDSGPGRMVEASDLYSAVEECAHTSNLLAGKRVLISAGPTREYLDPVRYLTNRSSGKMGIALAREALRAGAEVVDLVLGPTAEPVPVHKRFTCVDVAESARDMRNFMTGMAPFADIIICTAAVADYRPAERFVTKIKKQQSPQTQEAAESGRQDMQTLELVQNPDILAELGRMKAAKTLKSGAVLVGFAAETDNLEANVRAKLESKGADYIVANDVSRTDIGFESGENEVRIFSKASPEKDTLLPKASKTQLARQILHIVSK